MLKRALFRLGIFEAKHPKIVLSLVVIFTLISVMGIPGINVQISYEKMMPENSDVIQTLHLVQDEYGGTDTIQILVEAPDVRDPETLRAIDTLESRLKEEKWVTEVSGISSIVKQSYGYIPPSKDTIKGIIEEPMTKQLTEQLMSDDYKYTLITARIICPYDPISEEGLTERIRDDIAYTQLPEGTSARISGMIPLDYESYLLMNKDLAVISCIGLLLVFSIVIFYFKSVIKGMLALAPVALAILWSAGWMGYIGIPFSILMTGSAAIIMGLGVDFGIHLIHRYDEEREKGKDVANAITGSVVNIGIGLVFVTATTMVGFLALCTGDIIVMREYGEMLAISILFCFMASMSLIPAVLALKGA